MSWWGWTSGGAAGSVRLDAGGTVIAHHGDRTWLADVDLAVDGETNPSRLNDTGK